MNHERIINDDLPWARNFARACAANLPSHIDRDDLQSAGIVAFVQAATRYDNTKGASFRGYCATRIRGAILDELRRWSWAPRSVHKDHRLYYSTVYALTGELMRAPTLNEISLRLGIDQKAAIELQESAQLRQMVPWEETSSNGASDDSLSLIERIADPVARGPDAALLCAEERRNLIVSIAKLSKIQALVIVLHYLKDVPLKEVAVQLGVTPSRISQIHHQALKRLKNLIQFRD